MMHALQRNLALVAGLAVAGLACGQASSAMTSVRGAAGPTFLLAQNPLAAGAAVVGAFLVAALMACAVGRVTNAAVGVFVLGAGVFVLAGRLETVDELAFASSAAGRGPLIRVAMETLAWSLAAAAGVWSIFAFTGGLRDIAPTEQGHRPHWFSSKEAWTSAAAGTVALPVVWLIAQSPLKGQAIGAAFLGSMVAGLAGRLLSPHVQPILLFAAPILAGAIGHVIGAMLLDQPLGVALVRRELSNLSMPMPVDYVAGSLMGVSIGLGWAKSFLHHEQSEGAAEAA